MMTFFFGEFINAQVQDIFWYRPLYEIENIDTNKYALEFISYKSNTQLRDVIDENDYDNPLYTLNEYISASSLEEVNSIQLEEAKSDTRTDEEIKRSSLLYKTDSVEVLIESQVIIEINNEHYSYLKYCLHFKHRSLVGGTEQVTFPALKVVVRKNDRWLLTQQSPLGLRFKLAFYDHPTNEILELLKGNNLVDGNHVVSNNGILNLDRLINGMDSNDGFDNNIRVDNDTMNVLYIEEDVKLKEVQGQFWLDKKGSHPVDIEQSIDAYNENQIKLFLAVHQAIIAYTENLKRTPISIKSNDLNLDDDMISKTHLVKYQQFSI